MPDIIKNIHKSYKNNTKITEYKDAWFPYTGQRNKNIKSMNQEINKARNTLRAKQAIHDIIACNTFQYFVTLTVSPKSTINRYDYDDCAKHISKWLSNNLNKYILVPEKHKDGAYHFHLLADIPKNKLTHYKKSIYNIKSYKYGYSTAISITDGSEQRIANYVQKYITKDLLNTIGHNRRRYWASKNLKRPLIRYNLPIPPTSTLNYQDEDKAIYTHELPH